MGNKRYPSDLVRSIVMRITTCCSRNRIDRAIIVSNHMNKSATNSLTLRERRTRWLEVLASDDPHSIVSQLADMATDIATFRAVNEARRLAPPASRGGVELNGPMYRLFDMGFFRSQIAAIRRLDDSFPIHGDLGVCSLIGLLNDMIKHRCLMTRRAILEAEELQYDYEDIRQKANQYSSNKLAMGESDLTPPRSLDHSWSEMRHGHIDHMAGVKPSNRNPSDTIKESLFTNLRERVSSSCTNAHLIADKFIAHASTPESRALVNADQVNVKLSELWTAHQRLCEVTGFLLNVVLGNSCRGFLTSQYDQFAYIDRPLIGLDAVHILRGTWENFHADCEKWRQWNLKDYDREFGTSDTLS